MQDKRQNIGGTFRRLRIPKWTLVCLLFGIHLVLAHWFFPVNELLDDSPIVNFDHPFHQQRSLDRVRFIADSGEIWGYNPKLMAGYVDGIQPLNDGITHWLNFLLEGRVGKYTIYKIWTISLFLFPVLITPFTVSLLSLRCPPAVVMILTVVLLNCTRIRLFYLWGMGTFVFANFVSLLSICLFWAYSRDRRGHIFLWLLVVFPLSFLFHPLAFVLQVIGYILISALRFRSFGLVGWLSIVGLAAVALAVNWHWIVTYLRFSAYVSQEVEFFLQTQPIQIITDLMSFSKLPMTLVILTALLGFWEAARERQGRELIFVFAPIVLCLLSLTYLGSHVGLKWLQPYRFFVSAPIFCIPFSALGILYVFKLIRKHADKRVLLSFATVSVVSVSVLPHLYHYSYSVRAVGDNTGEIRRITTFVSEELRWLAAWIATNTDTRSRIAIQEVGENAPIGGSHFIPNLARIAGRELMGNYHYKSHTVFGTSVVDEKFLGISFSDLNQYNLLEICDLYNIKTVVLHDEKSKSLMQQLKPAAVKVAQHGRFMVFDINMKPSFLLGGDGHVVAGLNAVSVSKRNEPVTVLKYHYFPFLAISPDLRIERYRTKYDPIGFIKVLNGGVTDFRIFLDYPSYHKSRGRLEY